MLDVAVVGLGWWGRVIVPLVKRSQALRLACVADPNPATEAFASEQGVPRVADYGQVLADSAVRAVVLCTPHTMHCEQIVAAAEAGKHVFCEKPLSLSRAEVLRAVAACEANGVALAVGHERRFEPPVIEAMRLVRSGALGRPLQVEANFSQDKFLGMASDNWRMSEREAPAGPLTATGIHLLDLSVGVFGEAATACASVKQLGSNLANGDTLAILLTFRNGGHALISAILATPFVGRFAVYCNEGWVEVRDRAHPESPQGWTLTVCRRGEDPVVTEYAPAPAVLANLEAFSAAAEGRAPYPVSQGEMVANISAFEAVIRATRSGQVETVEG
jgi:predicted dehydrogenase